MPSESDGNDLMNVDHMRIMNRRIEREKDGGFLSSYGGHFWMVFQIIGEKKYLHSNIIPVYAGVDEKKKERMKGKSNEKGDKMDKKTEVNSETFLEKREVSLFSIALVKPKISLPER